MGLNCRLFIARFLTLKMTHKKKRRDGFDSFIPFGSLHEGNLRGRGRRQIKSEEERERK